MDIENKASFETRLKNGISLFLGSGFSVLAKDKTGVGLAAGNGLRDELCEKFGKPAIKELNLSVVSQIIGAENPTDFEKYLTNRFSVGTFSPQYLAIKNINIRSIFTTNIDDLIFKIYRSDPDRYVNDILLQGQTFRDRAAIEYLALHGSVVHQEKKYTFSPIEIASAFTDNPLQFQYLTKSLNDTAMLFWGYRLEDAGSLQALNTHYKTGPNSKPRWIVLREPNEGAISYFRSLGFQIIISDTNEMLEYLESLEFEVRDSSTKFSAMDFKTGQIPTIDSVPVRSLEEFFKGFPPSWHEILSNRIPTTSHYQKLVNLLDQGSNVIVVGIPASGKSTLLMQAAAYYETDSIKLFETSITSEKARAYVSKVEGGGKLTLFLDNMSDSVEALDILTSSKSIRVVGADRSTNIGFGSHLFELSKFRQFDCTELSKSDLVSVFRTIPEAIKTFEMSVPEVVEEDASPSLFEFIQENVRGKKIGERYVDVLAELKNNSEEIHDLFVMICYVFSCHAPVSFDVVSRFIRAGGDYNKVYSAVDRLGKLLNNTDEAGGGFLDLDDTQDHFVPRSSLIAEIVVEKCRPEDFGRVYSAFHKNVPRLFIPNFATFKRYGYRNQLVGKAFSNWEEGEAFYLQAYKEDKTYFLMQQLAIYMGSKKKYALAFQYIDMALVSSKNKNPNIRHTHARLLFDANIDKSAENSELRSDLRQSMQILESCHDYDKRQTNHSQRFADQSIRYWEVFGDSEARSYLEKAEKWLNEEIKKIPSLRYARHLRKRVVRILR